jgi:hypothetical protein
MRPKSRSAKKGRSVTFRCPGKLLVPEVRALYSVTSGLVETPKNVRVNARPAVLKTRAGTTRLFRASGASYDLLAERITKRKPWVLLAISAVQLKIHTLDASAAPMHRIRTAHGRARLWMNPQPP